MKIKIIDLLNKIANGEELPKTIRWYDKFYNDYDEISNNYKAFVYERLKNEFWNLNDEVEILEEPKKIEKLEPFRGSDLSDLTDKDMILRNNALVELCKTLNNINNKVNELIDEINNLKGND